MKRVLFVLSVFFASSVLSYADDYKIIAISSGNVVIGGKTCKKGDVFNDNSTILWSSSNQAMKIRNVKSGRLFRIGKSELPSGKSMSYYIKVNHTSTRGAGETNLTLEELKDEARFAISENRPAKADKFLQRALSLPTCSSEDCYDIQKFRLAIAKKRSRKKRIISDVYYRLKNNNSDHAIMSEWAIYAFQNDCGDICTNLLRTLEQHVDMNNISNKLLLANTYVGVCDDAKASAIKGEVERELARLTDSQRYAYLFDLTLLYKGLECYQDAVVSGTQLFTKTKELMGAHSETYAEHTLLLAEIFVLQKEYSKAEQLMSELPIEDISEQAQHKLNELKERLHGSR